MSDSVNSPVSSAPEPMTYANSGVDVEAGDRAVELMKNAVKATHDSSVFSGLGGFAGMIDASSLLSYRKPLLATSTDGVGTKVAIAQAMDFHGSIGQDLVGMVVDDIAVVGAKPLLMTDYIACGKVVPERIAEVVRGIAEGCSLAGTPLVGGETAEHPGLLGQDEYDVAGAATGVVEADRVLGPERVRAGDVVIGMASSGLHSNGYSLVRSVVARSGLALTDRVDEFSSTLGEELLIPTRIYTKDCLALADASLVHALSHVTGGGLAANLARVLPQGLTAVVDRSTWSLPAVFEWVRSTGQVPLGDLERTLNVGVGMVAVVPQDQAQAALELLASRNVPSWVMGSVMEGIGAGAAADHELGDYVQGAKGVDGGAVLMHGRYAS